jgi:hypothetical protein
MCRAGTQHFDGLLGKKGEQSLPGGTDGIVGLRSALLYDFRTVHRGMPNKSQEARPIFYVLYARRNWKEIRNWGSSSVFEL